MARVHIDVIIDYKDGEIASFNVVPPEYAKDIEPYRAMFEHNPSYVETSIGTFNLANTLGKSDDEKTLRYHAYRDN